MKKKILLISAFYLENNTSRPHHMMLYFESIGYQTKVITTNFNHSSKKHQKIDSNNVIQLRVPSYLQTFSIKRVLSHIIYAIKLKRHLNNDNFDLVYIAVPPNYSAKIAAKISKRRNKFVISDIIDIWPQNIGRFPYNIFLNYWANMRNKTIKNSDLVLIETSAYNQYIDSIRKDTELVYLAKIVDRMIEYNKNPIENFKDILMIGYLGNFSDSYDFDSLIQISNLLNEKYIVKLIFVGDGYLKATLLNELSKNRIQFVDHGIIFEEDKKKPILEMCHFGYNAIKKEISVGLSYKSIDYLSYGLPLLNNIGYDTKNLINSYNAGINFKTSQDAFIKIDSLTKEQYSNMRIGALNLFNSCFSINSFYEKMNEIFRKRGL